MEEAALFLRGTAVGATLFLALAFIYHRRDRQSAWSGGWLLACIAAYLLWGIPGVAAQPWTLRLPVNILAAAAPYFLWLFIRFVFDDNFRWRRGYWLWLLGIEAFAVPAAIGFNQWPVETLRIIAVGFRLPALLLMTHALVVIGRDWQDDMVDQRRRFRQVLLAVAGGLALAVTFAAVFGHPAPDRAPLAQVIETAFLAVTILFGGVLLVNLPDDLLPERADIVLRGAPEADRGGAPVESPSLVRDVGADAEMLGRLQALMTVEAAWQDANLTVGGLAGRLAMPEYRLRQVINQHLGFRNFSAFLNSYRLAAAAVRLSDPGQMRTPILTIALEAGFGSIGPFNRAFRERFGMTPTDFRRQSWAAPMDPGQEKLAEK